MDFKPQFYKTHPLSLLFKCQSVIMRDGSLAYCVTLAKGEKEYTYFLFDKLGSAIDFLNSNFECL